MKDVIFIAAAIFFFLISVAYVRFCEKVK